MTELQAFEHKDFENPALSTVMKLAGLYGVELAELIEGGE